MITLKQARYLREIVRQSLSISAAAEALNTSQPGVSRQIQMLERELGVELLVRQRNRIVALTRAGQAILAAAQQLLNQADNIELLAQEVRGSATGKLVVATSHLHARYTLRAPFKALQKNYPDVQLLLEQAQPDDIPTLVRDGDADIGVSTTDDEVKETNGVIGLDGRIVRRSAIMLSDHPLAQREDLTLKDFENYPFVGYGPRSRAGQIIAKAFKDNGITVKFIVRANDSDIIKAYVTEGLGIGIVPAVTLDQGVGENLHAVDITDLLPLARTRISIRQDMYLQKYVTDFIGMLDPSWDRAAIRLAVGRAGGSIGE
jgi:LysR family transcriptional regulator, cys regulon transcriptional activator